jgi:hypothetical protein
MVQRVAMPIVTAYSTTFRFNTGRTPGIPRQTGQTWVFGGAPKAVEQPQKILVLVLSWAWISSPMTVTNSIFYPLAFDFKEADLA